jgi:hypothetical protein
MPRLLDILLAREGFDGRLILTWPETRFLVEAIDDLGRPHARGQFRDIRPALGVVEDGEYAGNRFRVIRLDGESRVEIYATAAEAAGDVIYAG